MRPENGILFVMFCLLVHTAYRLYKLPEDGTDRRGPLLFLCTFFAVFFGIALALVAVKEFS